MNKLLLMAFAITTLAACSTKTESNETDTPVSPSQSTSETSESTTDNAGSTTDAATGDAITFTEDGFSPSTLTVKAGTLVAFKNDSSKTMRPASADHPSHGVYPTTGGCVGSTFDSCKAIQPGETWFFKFEEKGEWSYHDHLDPSKLGKVVVE